MSAYSTMSVSPPTPLFSQKSDNCEGVSLIHIGNRVFGDENTVIEKHEITDDTVTRLLKLMNGVAPGAFEQRATNSRGVAVLSNGTQYFTANASVAGQKGPGGDGWVKSKCESSMMRPLWLTVSCTGSPPVYLGNIVVSGHWSGDQVRVGPPEADDRNHY